MAKHEVLIHENTSATKESAPYLGSYLSKETMKTVDFASKIAERCGLPAIQVQAIIAGAFDAIGALEHEGLVRMHIDGFVVCGFITGSFLTADAAFDPAKNALQMALRLEEPIRNHLADVVPVIVSDATVTKLRVDNVMDMAEQRPYNVIHGMHVFRVAGYNMVLTDEGAGAALVNAMGVSFPLVIDEVVSKQLFKAHTATLLEPGDYKLVVKSKAGDAEGPMQTDFRRVKYLKVIDPPTVTKIATEGLEGVAKGCAFDVIGTDLAYGAGDSMKAKWTLGGEAHELALTPTAVTPTKMSFAAQAAFNALADNAELTFEVKVGSTTIVKTTTLLPKQMKLTKVTSDGREGVIIQAVGANLYGENLGWAEGDKAQLKYYEGGEEKTIEVGSTGSETPDTRVILQIDELPAVGTAVTIWWKGKSIGVTVAAM